MGLIFQNNFSLGWRATDAPLSDPPNALLRMQNLKLDETGALTLIPGTAKVNGSQFAAAPHSIFSRWFAGNIKPLRLVSLANGKTFIDDNYDGSFAHDVIVSGGSTYKTAFAAAYGEILICSGAKKVKVVPSFSTNQATPIGPGTPNGTPTITYNNPYTIDLTGTVGSYTALWGTVSASGSWVKCVMDSTVNAANAIFTYASDTDTTNLSGGSVGLDSDLFHMTVRCTDPSKIHTVSVQFGNSVDSSVYFEKIFSRDNNDFIFGPITDATTPAGADASLECTRGDFQIVGLTTDKDWTKIKTIRVLVWCDDATPVFYFTTVKFSGGTLGTLNGTVEYIQVNVNDRGAYTARGVMSAIKRVTLNNTSAHIVTVDHTSGTNNFYNTGWEIYRRGGLLEQFYRVANGTGIAAAIDDTMSDADAQLQGITFNVNLSPIQDLTDDIVAIEGPYMNRMLFFTLKRIYISEINNSASYDKFNGVLAPYGSSGEFFLWARKLGNSSVIIGTTNDIYELTGTLSPLPDGTIDATFRSFGCKNPPICDAVATDSTNLYYIASDGARVHSPSGNFPLGDQLDLLWKNKARYGVNSIQLYPGNQVVFYAAVSKNELYLSMTDSTGARVMYVWDILRKYWFQIKTSQGGFQEPSCLFTEEDGTLLAGYNDTGSGGNLYLRILNTGTLLDGSGKPAISMRTKFYNGDMPRNRKDSYTLKIKGNTGGDNVALGIYLDDGVSPVSLGNFNSSGLGEVSFDLVNAGCSPAKDFSLELIGTPAAFNFTDFSIDFDPRPTQLTFYRSQPTNYGIQGRKRLYEVPIVIDTLGQTVTMKVYVDTNLYTTKTFSTTNKSTYTFYFDGPVVGTDLYFTLDGGGKYFEFYEATAPRIIEQLPDSTKAYTIPNNNLGSYARKRITAFAFTIDTRGSDVVFTPVIDGASGIPTTINTSRKQTVIYYFTNDTTGVDIGGTLVGSNPFEFYQVDLAECISEKLPASTKIYVIPQTNLGTISRKRIVAFAFVIDTRGSQVVFTPSVDGNPYLPLTISTSRKQTVIYYFTNETVGTDIGGTLTGSNPFEYYGVNLEECVSEKLPVPTEFLVLPTTNFGVANKKRLRTVPMVLDPKGGIVTYTPVVDGTAYATSQFTGTGKRTYLHYFTTDVFGIDLWGSLSSSTPFEFYAVLTPENVEVLPVGKLFDQLGPIEFNKNGNLKFLRVRLLATTIQLGINVFMDDVLKYTTSIATIPNIDKGYDIPLTKFLNGTTCRIELSAQSVFYRWGASVKVNITGSQTDAKWIKVA